MITTFTPKCLVCETRFSPNWNDTRIVHYFRPLQFCEVCPDCQTNFSICEICDTLHWTDTDCDGGDTDPELKELPSYPGDDTTH